MPSNYVHPRKSGVHRVACISLYRALLSKCPNIEVPQHLKRGKIHPVAEIVRKQFRRNFRFESPMLVVGALKVGYEAEELLHDVLEGDSDARTKMITLLEGYQAQSNATRAINLAHPPPPKSPHIVPRSRPGARKILKDYPLSLSAITSGKRKVPSLATANGFPILMYRKPQSPYLGRIIRDSISLRLKRQRVIGKLEEGMKGDSVASMENEWDMRVGESQGKPSGKGGWKQAYEESLWLQKQRVREESQKVKEMSVRMTEIYLEEKRLAEEEKDVRRKERMGVRRRERKERRDKEFLDTLSPEDRERTIERLREDETKTAEHAYLYSLSPRDRDKAVEKLREDRKRKQNERNSLGGMESKYVPLAPKDNVEEWWSEMAFKKNNVEGSQSKYADKTPIAPEDVAEGREIGNDENNAGRTLSKDVDQNPFAPKDTVEERREVANSIEKRPLGPKEPAEEGREIAIEKNNAGRMESNDVDKMSLAPEDIVEEGREIVDEKSNARGSQSKNVKKKPLAPGLLAYKVYNRALSKARIESGAQLDSKQVPEDHPKQAEEIAAAQGLSAEEWEEREKEKYIDQWGLRGHRDLWGERVKSKPRLLEAVERARKTQRRGKDEAKVVPQGGDHKRAFLSWKPNGGS